MFLTYKKKEFSQFRHASIKPTTNYKIQIVVNANHGTLYRLSL